MGYKSFEDLEVYKAAREFRKKIYKLSLIFKREKAKHLAEPFRGAVLSNQST